MCAVKLLTLESPKIKLFLLGTNPPPKLVFKKRYHGYKNKITPKYYRKINVISYFNLINHANIDFYRKMSFLKTTISIGVRNFGKAVYWPKAMTLIKASLGL